MIASVFVPGVPVPQGSARAFVVGKRAIVTGANPKTNPWRADVAAGVRSAIGTQIVHPTGAVAVDLRFVMPRRKSEPKRITPAHTRKPDLDKLARALCDALTGLIFTDDSQVSELLAAKRTAAIGEQPGVLIRWAPVGPDMVPPAAARPHSPALPRGAHIGTHGITIDGAELPWYVSAEGVIVREEYGTTNPVAHTIQVRIIVDGPVLIDHAVDVHDHGDGMLEVCETWAEEDE